MEQITNTIKENSVNLSTLLLPFIFLLATNSNHGKRVGGGEGLLFITFLSKGLKYNYNKNVENASKFNKCF